MAQILLVDDDAGILTVLTSLFEDEGWDVLSARGGQEALSLLADSTPSIILLDLMMPGMSGQEFLVEMRQRGLSVPVVLMSARKNVAEIAESAQVSGYLTKPFDIDDALTVAARFAREGSGTGGQGTNL